MKQQRNGKSALPWKLFIPLIFPMMILLIVNGCKKEDPDASGWKTANSSCVTASCHGNKALKKDIMVTGKTIESIPLYVDSAAFVNTQHKDQLCTGCHTDITVTNGTHGSSTKVFGGWARFSKTSGTKALATPDSTRNYSTAASTACKTCHTAQYNENSAHIKIARLREASIRNFGTHKVGEAYEDNNCSRCHATCATCHFKSEITPKVAFYADLLQQSNWDGVQTAGDNYNNVVWGDATEWRMDWTKNVSSHEFRTKADLNGSNDVCRSCHIGFYRPPVKGFAMRNGVVDSMFATGIKRHPQYQELLLGTTHKTTTCGTCHGKTLHNQVNIAGGPECIDCHAAKGANHPSPNHMSLKDGVKIKCISCHTSHRASDFSGSGQSNWINPEVTSHKEIGPVVVKYSELLNWYPHYMTKTVNCTALCHFEGNRVGAHKMGPLSIPVSPKMPFILPANTSDTDE